MKKLQDALAGLAIVSAVLLLCWFLLAGLAWPFNNPLGNDVTFWTHFGAAMRFERVPALQERP